MIALFCQIGLAASQYCFSQLNSYCHFLNDPCQKICVMLIPKGISEVKVNYDTSCIKMLLILWLWLFLKS